MDTTEDQARTLGPLSDWITDGALAGLLMAGVGVGVLFCTDLRRHSPHPEDAKIIAAAMAAGTVIGALLAPALRLYARLTLRLGVIPALLAGPVAGAAAGLVLTSTLEGRYAGIQDPRILALFGTLGAGASGPPWAAYLAVRVKQRSTIGVIIGAAVWTVVPSLFVAALFQLTE